MITKYDLLKKVTGKTRQILVDRSQVCDILDIMELDCDIPSSSIHVGNCGWKKAPNCYFIHTCWISDEKWFNCLREFNRKGITLLPETTGY